MKADAYMPFYGKDLFQAISAHNEIVGLAYVRALWHYWSHTHCEGLQDDDDALRRICNVEKADWPKVKNVLFSIGGEFFRIDESGKWHQERCKAEYARLLTRKDSLSHRARTAAVERWRKHHQQ